MLKSAPPIPDPSTLSFEQLRDLVEMQQRTIAFLIDEYNDLLDMVSEAGNVFGTPQNFNTGDAIPEGWWQMLSPTTGNVVAVTVGSTTVNPPANSLVWSDGTNVKAAATATLVKVATRPAS